MPASLKLTNFMLLPELKFIRSERIGKSGNLLWLEKEPRQEYCNRCGSGDYWVHEHRWIELKDEPIRGSYVVLRVRKRRLKCLSCGKIFSEPLPGVLPEDASHNALGDPCSGPAKPLVTLKEFVKTIAAQTTPSTKPFMKP